MPVKLSIAPRLPVLTIISGISLSRQQPPSTFRIPDQRLAIAAYKQLCARSEIQGDDAKRGQIP
jgi:hypothetical protein